MLFARHSVVTHAKAFGLDAIDLVDTDYRSMSTCIIALCILLYTFEHSCILCPVYLCTLLVYPCILLVPPCVFLYIVDLPHPLNISGYSCILLIYLCSLLYILEHSCISLNTPVYLCILLFLRSGVTEGAGGGGGEDGVHRETGHPPRPATCCDGGLLSLTRAGEVGRGTDRCIPLPPAVRQGKLLDKPVVSLKNSQIEDVLK